MLVRRELVLYATSNVTDQVLFCLEMEHSQILAFHCNLQLL